MTEEVLIRGYIEKILKKKGRTLTASDVDPLISSGLLDSVTVQELIVKLQENLGLDLSADTFSPEHFDSIQSICNLIRSIRRAA